MKAMTYGRSKTIEPEEYPDDDTPNAEVLAGLYRALQDVKAGRISPVEELWETTQDHIIVGETESPKYRQTGAMKGMFTIGNNFDEPL